MQLKRYNNNTRNNFLYNNKKYSSNWTLIWKDEDHLNAVSTSHNLLVSKLYNLTQRTQKPAYIWSSLQPVPLNGLRHHLSFQYMLAIIRWFNECILCLVCGKARHVEKSVCHLKKAEFGDIFTRMYLALQFVCYGVAINQENFQNIKPTANFMVPGGTSRMDYWTVRYDLINGSVSWVFERIVFWCPSTIAIKIRDDSVRTYRLHFGMLATKAVLKILWFRDFSKGFFVFSILTIFLGQCELVGASFVQSFVEL